MTQEDAQYIRSKVMAHNKWFEECIPMIASENLMSPLAKEMLISDFADRYAEGLPGKRYYQGNIYVDEVELKAIELAKKVFDADFADVRPISSSRSPSPATRSPPAPWPREHTSPPASSEPSDRGPSTPSTTRSTSTT